MQPHGQGEVTLTSSFSYGYEFELGQKMGHLVPLPEAGTICSLFGTGASAAQASLTVEREIGVGGDGWASIPNPGGPGLTCGGTPMPRLCGLRPVA